MSDTLDLTTVSEEPVESNVQVEITDAPETDAEGTVEEPVEEPEEVAEPLEEPEETVEEEASEEVSEPVEEAPEEVAEPEEVTSEEVSESPEEAPVTTEEPVSVEEPVSTAPVEQVASDIRNILTEVPTLSSELTDDLKQRIAELDYLRECCGNWVGSGRRGKSTFLTSWENKSVTVDSSIDYGNVLVQLEKLPELIKLWAERKVSTNSNHFKNIESYNLTRSLFNGKSDTEKVEILEQLITLLTDCANGKMRTNQIEEFIDNLY